MVITFYFKCTKKKKKLPKVANFSKTCCIPHVHQNPAFFGINIVNSEVHIVAIVLVLFVVGNYKAQGWGGL
jgi:hypothetical protein